MDRPRLNDQLGVKKIGKNIKKSPLHQPNLANGIAPSRPRLQKIRPAALTQINQPLVSPPTHNLARPTMLPLPQGSQPLMGHGDQVWSYNTSDSPVSVYMRYLQSSIADSGHNGNQMQPQAQGHAPTQPHNHHSPRFNGSTRDNPILPTPRFNDLPSPRFNGRGILPSPTSQYLLQSPAANRNMLSPRSPYPLSSPGVRDPPPLTPRTRSFTFSSMDQPGILGPGTFPQPPPPGLVSPSSPYGFFPNL